MKVVINRCHGGFGLSEKAILRYLEIQGKQVWVEQDAKYGSLGITHYYLVPPEQRIEDATGDTWYAMSMEQRQEHNRLWSEQNFYDRDIARDDPVLVQVVQELGEDANGRYAELAIVEIPDDVEWQIEEYDGAEWVAEVHRTWS